MLDQPLGGRPGVKANASRASARDLVEPTAVVSPRGDAQRLCGE